MNVTEYFNRQLVCSFTPIVYYTGKGFNVTNMNFILSKKPWPSEYCHVNSTIEFLCIAVCVPVGVFLHCFIYLYVRTWTDWPDFLSSSGSSSIVAALRVFVYKQNVSLLLFVPLCKNGNSFKTQHERKRRILGKNSLYSHGIMMTIIKSCIKPWLQSEFQSRVWGIWQAYFYSVTSAKPAFVMHRKLDFIYYPLL
jgi:hypothetical protein